MKLITVVLLIAVTACGDDTKFTVEQLQNPETCKECHPKHYEQWSGSMHAYASEDPVFLAMNKRGQRDTNQELGEFCIKCHAPMAVLAGVKGVDFDPSTLPPEQKGITCFFCHNVEKVEGEHNNGLILAMDQTMRGGAKNAADTPAHFSKFDDKLMASKTNDSTLCGACHDVTTMPANVHLERTFAEWKTTIFAQQPGTQTYLSCSKCHMTPTTGVIADKAGLDVKSRTDGFHDHHMAAIDTALTPFPQLDVQKAEIEKILKPAVAIVGYRSPGSNMATGGICLPPNGAITVRVDSLGVGHSFPSGAAQDRRVWIEVTAYDASDNVVFASGHVPDDMDPEQVNDKYLQCPTGPVNCAGFWDRTKKADGTQAHFFWDVASYESNLIRPPVTLDPNSGAYDHSTTVEYMIGNTSMIDRVEARVLVRALPIAAIDDLVASGDLDPTIRAKLVAPEATLVATTSTWLRSTMLPSTRCNPF